MRISILLPYKENFSPVYPGAVSIFINSVSKYSKFKKNIFVYGNTKYKKVFKINYTNIPLDRKFLSSQSNDYVTKFITLEKKKPSDIIEIHNRPIYISLLKQLNANLVLYFHNDPLSMNGSIKKKERLVIGKTNKNDILRILGYPSTKSSFDNDLWIYIERKIDDSSLFKLGTF